MKAWLVLKHNIQIKKMKNAVTFTVVIREEQLIVK